MSDHPTLHGGILAFSAGRMSKAVPGPRRTRDLVLERLGSGGRLPTAGRSQFAVNGRNSYPNYGQWANARSSPTI